MGKRLEIFDESGSSEKEVQPTVTETTSHAESDIATEQDIQVPASASGAFVAPRSPGVPDRAYIKKKRRRASQKRRMFDWMFSTAFLLPSLLGVVIFYFYPYIMLLIQSFLRSFNNSEFVGFTNYVNVINNQGFRDASMNTLIFSAYAVPLAVVLSLLLALLLNSKIPGGSWFRSSFLQPLIVPVASIVLIWQVFFSYNGTINTLLQSMGQDKIDWLKSDQGRIVILLLFLWKNLGYNMVLFLSALNNIPEEFLEAARIDGAGPVKRFFSICMPYLYPTVFFVGIMSLINSFKVFREIYLLTGDIPVNALYMLQHFMNNAFKNLDYQKLSAGAVVMSIVMVVIVGVLFLAENKLGRDVEE